MRRIEPAAARPAHRGRRRTLWPYGGAANPATKLTDADVSAIRSRYAAGGVTQRQLGEEYEVSQAAISRITLGGNWRYTTKTEEA